MTINLKLKTPLSTLLEVAGCNPDQLANLSKTEIEGKPVRFGNRKSVLGDHFEVSITHEDPFDHVLWKGDLANVNGIGLGMTSGLTTILGNVGNYVGAQMSGGTIKVQGNVRDLAGAEMSGGLLRILGSAGDFVGGSFEGQSLGQNGGTILINRNAGNDLGCEMRRGLIAVAGDAGDRCGYRMRAGTILVGGETGESLGLNMVRGTICLARSLAEAPLGFSPGGRAIPPVLRLVVSYLSKLGFHWAGIFPEDLRLQQFHGDKLNGSRGEIFSAIQ